MDGRLFDRITRTLAGSAPRRATLRATAAAALGGISASIGREIAEAKNKKKNRKKRCRERLKKCGGRKKCCNGSGRIKCQNVQEESKPQCDGKSGRRCCGLDGASCNRDELHCDCCGFRTFCVEVGPGEFRCQDDLT